MLQLTRNRHSIPLHSAEFTSCLQTHHDEDICYHLQTRHSQTVHIHGTVRRWLNRNLFPLNAWTKTVGGFWGLQALQVNWAWAAGSGILILVWGTLSVHKQSRVVVTFSSTVKH